MYASFLFGGELVGRESWRTISHAIRIRMRGKEAVIDGGSRTKGKEVAG